MRNGQLNPDESKPVPLTTVEVQKYRTKPGAFYAVRGNGNRTLVGRAGRAPETEEPVAFPDLLIEIMPDQTKLIPEYFRYVWDALDVRRDIEERSRTAAGIVKINLKNLSEVALRVTDTTTQSRMPALLHKQFDDQARLERQSQEQLAAINALPAALLRQAFSGQL